MKEQGLFHSGTTAEPVYSDTLSLDLSTVEPSLAGPRRPQDRVSLRDLPRNFQLARSEEHTSELQSPCNFVCRLLLEKKKNNSADVPTDASTPFYPIKCNTDTTSAAVHGTGRRR